MKTTKFYRLISILLALVILTSSFTFNSFAKTTDTDTANKSGILDWFWDLFHTTSVSVSGLPEGAEPSIEKVSNPFNRKSGSSAVGSFLGFYDIKATDKETGKEIHPNGEFEVRLQGVKLEKDQSVYVIHVLDTEDAIKNTPNVRFIDDAGFVNAFKNEASLTEKTTGRKGSVAVEIINNVTVDDGDVVFTTRSFSIFAVVDNPIITVNFYESTASGAEPVASIRVKQADTIDDEEYKRVVYEPGIQSVTAANALFRGWTTDAQYTVEDADDAMSIQEVRADIKNKLSGSNPPESINYYAMLYKRYTVTFFDELHVTCFGVDYALQRYDSYTNGEPLNFRVNVPYTPYTEAASFLGWKLETDFYDNFVGVYTQLNETGTPTDGMPPALTGDAAKQYIYNNPVWVRITGDISLYAYAPGGHWLVFDENGKGATYVAPQFVEDVEDGEEGNVTIDPAEYPDGPIEMERYGYRFDGWYLPQGYEKIDDGNGNMVDDKTKPLKDAEGNVILGERFVFGHEMTESLTIYAKWTPNETAAYTVIVWVEKSADTYEGNVTSGEREYDFYTSFTFTGNTGTTVTAVSNGANVSDIDGTYPNARIRGTQPNGQALDRTIEITGYHQNTEKTQTQVRIVPEGTSVINVYYDRHTVRYTFYYPYGAATSQYEKYTGNSAGQYYIKNGDNYDGPYYMTYSNGVWTYATGEYVYTPYTGTESGSYYIDGDEGKELIELTRVGDTWLYQTTVTGYHLTSSTANGNYYISDGNGGYIQKYLTRSGNAWTYDTGDDEYVESNSTSSGYYYIPDGNGGYRQVYLNRSGNSWTINGEYDYVYTPQQNADNYSGNSGSNVSNPYGSDDGVNFYQIYWGREYGLAGTRAFWKTRNLIGYSDRYHGMVYSRQQVPMPYSGPIYIQTDILATVTEAYEYGPYQITEVYDGTVYTRAEITVDYSGDVYTPAAGGNAWRLYYQQTGLYGEDLNWPTDTEIWWYPNGSSTGGTSGTRMTYKSALLPMDANMDVVYYGSRGTGSNEIRFYTQDLAGGNNYTLQIAVSSSASTFNINDKFTGFEAYQYRSYSNRTGWSSWRDVGTLNQSTGVYGSGVDINSILEIRYRRLRNTITFLDGKYVNGNNISQDETLHPSAFRITDEMYVDTDISVYNKGGSSYYIPEAYHDGYVFAGWYSDDACTLPYTFTTMQLTGVTVYAKWVQVQYRVFLHPNAGSASDGTKDMSLDWGSDSQEMNFRVSYGGTISIPTGRRDMYYFLGWYTDPNFSSSSYYYSGTRINDNTPGLSEYNKTTDLTDKMDKWGDLTGDADHNNQPWNSDLVGNNGGDRFWITQKLDLYAKWSSKLIGAKGIYLEYDAVEGEGHFADNSTLYSDGLLYADNSDTYAIAATYPDNTGMHFSSWQPMVWVYSETETGNGHWAEAGNVRYPGEKFAVTIQGSGVKIERRLEGSTGDFEVVASVPDGEDGYEYKYTVRLSAKYLPAVPDKTHLTYDANGGSFTFETVPEGYTAATVDGFNTISTELLVNEVFDIFAGTIVAREGYTFKGWSLERNGTKFLDGGEENYAADNLTADPTGNDPSNTLYAIWEINRYKVDVEKILPLTNSTYTNAYEFTFDYTIEYPTGYNRVTGVDAVSTNGNKVSVNAKNTIENIPHGSKITVTERLTTAEAAVFNVTYNIVTIDPVVAEHDGDLAGTIKITNTFKSGKIKITKALSSGSATDEQFMFRITGGTLANPLTVTVKAGNSVTVAELQPGTYKVTEVTAWSWRYDLDTTVTGNTVERSVVIDGGETEEVTFTNKRNDKNWLYGENAKDNAYGN